MKNGSGLGNAALPALESGDGGDAEVEEALAEIWAGWLGRRRGGELGQSCRFVAELAEEEAERRESAGKEMRLAGAQGGIIASKWRRWGSQAGSLSTYGRHGASTRRPAGD